MHTTASFVYESYETREQKEKKIGNNRMNLLNNPLVHEITYTIVPENAEDTPGQSQ
jgi:phosphoribosylformylglycinamidine (FGAM) synthase PurS component